MRICVVSTTILPCLPPNLGGYGGLEPIAWQCAAGLARRGHEVMLVAPNGSVVPPGVELHGTTQGESEQQAYSGYWQKLPGFDAVIDHSWNKFSYMLKIEGKLNASVLGVCHAPIHTMYAVPPPILFPCLVAISQDQSAAISEHLGVASRVAYNSIDLSMYVRQPVERTNRYLFLARMSRIKGPQIAADLAKKLRFTLDLVGDDRLTGEPDLAQRLRMMSSLPGEPPKTNIIYHGGVSREKTVDFFSAAKALLHCNQVFREPFGLSPCEAQACGLPVISFDNGAMRETIVHGESGFLVKTVDEMEKLIKDDAVSSIKPEACRASAERFSVKAMVDAYERLCVEAVENGGW